MANIYGNDSANTLTGTEYNDSIYGYGGNDSLYGNAGNDMLNGGTGADTMLGGSGNDIYYVDNIGDKVYETTTSTSTTDAGGVDTVYSYLTSYTLGSYVENGRILNTGAAKLTGNTMNNTLYAGAGNNIINGGTGTDTVSYAYAGSAVTVNLALTTAQTTGGSGSDTLLNIENLIGSANNDNLTGNAGNNTLNGGAGSDYMAGGAGNDTYIVDNTGDTVYEASGSGTDSVNSYIDTYTLSANVENLTLYGAAITGKGNELNNAIIGNGNDNWLVGGAGNDTINGGTGNDSMFGQGGNDTYVVDSIGDLVFDGQGTDRINAYISYTLPDGIENLGLYGTATSGTGNSLKNTIYGNSNGNSLYGMDGNDNLYGYDGNDILNGGAGNDTMTGGAGNDVYLLDSTGDIVNEASGAGTDSVYACGMITEYSLGANVENLKLAGGNAVNGTGNELNNELRGNMLDNKLFGLAGNDTLRGSDGNDTVYGGDGNDILFGGEDNDYLSGGIGNDTVNGGAGDDYVFGGDGGNDVLTGGAGQDGFDPIAGPADWDTITDFSHVDDYIALTTDPGSTTIPGLSFTGNVTGSVLVTSMFFKGAGLTGNGSTDAIGFYVNTTTGSVYFNETSNVGGDSLLCFNVGATAAASMDNTDFVLVVR